MLCDFSAFADLPPKRFQLKLAWRIYGSSTTTQLFPRISLLDPYFAERSLKTAFPPRNSHSAPNYCPSTMLSNSSQAPRFGFGTVARGSPNGWIIPPQGKALHVGLVKPACNRLLSAVAMSFCDRPPARRRQRSAGRTPLLGWAAHARALGQLHNLAGVTHVFAAVASPCFAPCGNIGLPAQAFRWYRVGPWSDRTIGLGMTRTCSVAYVKR